MDINNQDKIKMSNGNILPMVRTKLEVETPLFSDKKIEKPADVVDLLGNYMADLAYESSAVVCLDHDNRPICVSLIGIGDDSETPMPVRSVLQVALLSNAAAVAVVHNHPNIAMNQKCASASQKDVEAIDIIMKGCMFMGIVFYDSIILAHDYVDGKVTPTYYSMKEKEVKRWKKNLPTHYAKGLIKSTYVSERFLPWDNYEDASRYWGADITKFEDAPQYVASSPSELKYVIELVNAGHFDNNKKDFLKQAGLNKAKELKSALDALQENKKRIETVKNELQSINEALKKIPSQESEINNSSEEKEEVIQE